MDHEAYEEADKTALPPETGKGVSPLPEGRPFSAPIGTWPMDEWPLDVVMTDETGDVDMGMVFESMRMTPRERAVRHDQARQLAMRLREAGRKLRGNAI